MNVRSNHTIIVSLLLAVPPAGGGYSRQLSAQNVVINEFLAANGTSLRDEDGDSSDWLEVLNRGAAVDLGGWFLSDDPGFLSRWRFPAVMLPAGGFLVVFASGKDRSAPGAELHTNFKLDAAGEPLILSRPDGVTVAHRYFPQFPSQRPDVSYGLAMEVASLVAEGTAASVLVPSSGVLGPGWTLPAFVPDGSWIAPAPTGIGFDDGSGGLFPAPLAHWSLDGTLADAAGGHDGAFQGGAAPAYATGFNGAAGGAVALDGADDGIVVPGGGGLPIHAQPAYTISLWVKGLPQADRRVFAEGSTASTTPLFTIGTDSTGATGAVDVFVRADGGTIALNHVKSAGVAFDGAWHHIAWVDENGAAALYIDGVRDSRNFNYTKPALSLSRTGLGLIPRSTACCWFNGAIDDVAVWESSLSETQIAALADGASPLGGSIYGDLIRTDIGAAMQGVNSTVYMRIAFNVADPSRYQNLTLRVRYDDGFAAYLNGQEVARRNAPASLAWNSAATAERAPAAARAFESINVSAFAGNLVAGTNILALQGLNRSAGDADLLLTPELEGSSAFGLEERYFAAPTPGAPNAAGFTGIVADTVFSHDRGFHDAPFSVTISTATSGAEIRYTLDGSPPAATSGSVYTGPIPIGTTATLRAAAFRAGFVPTNIDTHTYIFLDDVPAQTRPPTYPSTWSGTAAEYELNPAVHDAPAYRDLVRDAFLSIPSLSLVTAAGNLFGTTGLYTNPEAEGAAWERPVSAELIRPDGREGFQIDAGLRIQGGASRIPDRSPKHSLRLLFKSIYGAGKLRYPLYPGSPVEEFDTITLRAGYNNSWIHNTAAQRQAAEYIRDQWARDVQLAMGRLSSHGTYVHLFVNGLYWGLYNPVERPEASFAASYLGGEGEEYDALNSAVPVDGDKNAWNAMVALADAGLSTSTAYAAIQSYLDVDNLADYMIINLHAGNLDWAQHNWYAARRRAAGAGFQFFSWDAERILEATGEDRSDLDNPDAPTRLHLRLRQNAEYRLLFADHVHRHYFNGGVLTPPRAWETFDRRARELDLAVILESARWGDYRGTLYTRNGHWLVEKTRLRDSYFPARSGTVLNQFRADGLYPAVAAPAFNRHGGRVSPGFQLAISAPAGTIHYTLDGSDPRLPGGAVSPAAVDGGQGTSIAIHEPVLVRARAFSGAWSAMNEAFFYFDIPLRVTEIMYHPASPAPESPFTADEFEFLEIQNVGLTPLDLEGFRFRGAVEFDFAGSGIVLGPDEVLLVVENLAAFAERYPFLGAAIAGQYAGRLGNAADRVMLEGPAGEPILDFEYSDLWLPETDGGGRSLEIADRYAPPSAWGDEGSWQASAAAGGSPGEVGAGPPPGGRQLPGDANQDGSLDVSDAVRLLLHLFPAGGALALPCGGADPASGGNLALLDLNGDLALNLTDPVHVLNYIFLAGAPPALGTNCVRIDGCPNVCD